MLKRTLCALLAATALTRPLPAQQPSEVRAVFDAMMKTSAPTGDMYSSCGPSQISSVERETPSLRIVYEAIRTEKVGTDPRYCGNDFVDKQLNVHVSKRYDAERSVSLTYSDSHADGIGSDDELNVVYSGGSGFMARAYVKILPGGEYDAFVTIDQRLESEDGGEFREFSGEINTAVERGIGSMIARKKLSALHDEKTSFDSRYLRVLTGVPGAQSALNHDRYYRFFRSVEEDGIDLLKDESLSLRRLGSMFKNLQLILDEGAF